MQTTHVEPAVLAAIEALKPFMPESQLKFMVACLRGEEGAAFAEQLVAMDAAIKAMPRTYDQDGLGNDAVAGLHYFMGGMDWHITELDRDGDGTQQAFGLANLGWEPELGYICIRELLGQRAMQLDLYWTPKTLAQIRAK